jgi:hypothetical protein
MAEILTEDKFKEIYSSKKFRNNVAFAHKSCDKEGNFKHFESCSYPIRYIVSEQQKLVANKLREVEKAKTLSEIGNKLVFVGMGCDFNAPDGYMNNHRVRTTFLNSDGHKYFIELGTYRIQSRMWCDYSIDEVLREYHEKKVSECSEKMEAVKKFSDEWHRLVKERQEWHRQPYYNFGGIERAGDLGEYTKENVLKLVNETFGCKFTVVEIDEYDLSPDDFICKSPK